MESDNINNAIITETFLGLEDHGILTFIIHCKGHSFGAGFGCMGCNSPALPLALEKLFKVLGVSSWEEIAGSYVRVKSLGFGSELEAIGHLIEERWLTAKELSRILKEEP